MSVKKESTKPKTSMSHFISQQEDDFEVKITEKKEKDGEDDTENLKESILSRDGAFTFHEKKLNPLAEALKAEKLRREKEK